MNSAKDPKNPKIRKFLDPEISKYLDKGLYVNDDDQDWGSAGMNDVQKESK